jgi:Leucine-rich repeat (LRR) protein
VHNRLKFLNVSKCNISDKAALSLAQVIRDNPIMEGIFAHFNNIKGAGGGAIADAISGSKSMKKKTNKDLAGLLGTTAGGFYEEYAEKWSRMFQKNRSLVHVDLSHNKIREIDCEIIAEGLKGNHVVLGLHFQGNFGTIDHLGFMEPYMPEVIGEQAQIFRMQKQLQSGIITDIRVR